MSLVVSKLPPTSPLVPLTFDCLKAKVEETMGLLGTGSPLAAPTTLQPTQDPTALVKTGPPLALAATQGPAQDPTALVKAEPVQDPTTAPVKTGPPSALVAGQESAQDPARRGGKYEPYMVIVLFELLAHVHRHMLHYLLNIIEEIVTKMDKKMQVILCHLLFKIISKNYDYTRKEVCIKWYLELCHKLDINKLAKL